MSWERAIEGTLYTGLSEKIVNNGGTWVLEEYYSGHHPHLGELTSGITGDETIRKTLIPDSLVDPRITVNGKRNDTLGYLVDPEFRHLIEPTVVMPLERLLEGIEIDLAAEPISL